MIGNESILEEFFTNKLAISLEKVLYSDPETEMKCAQTLVKYGRSLGCYEYDEITELDMGEGTTLLSQSLLNGNNYLLSSLKQMGANPHKKDDFGISPMFWAIYLKQDIGQLIPDEKTLQMIEKVENIGKSSIQNKLLTNLSDGRPQLSYIEKNPTTALVKMGNGYSMNVNDNVLANLKKSRSNNHSLLGFIEKLKNNKVFPDGKQCLEYIMWDAKIHLIKLIASGENKLQPIHLMALYLYTGNLTLYRQVNMTLSNWSNNNTWHPFIACLYQAITLLPEYRGEVYRAIDCKFTMDDYAIGHKIRWDTFSMCSLEWKNSSELIALKRGIVFIIKSLTGRVISKYSKYPVDSEVIFLPGTEFIITDHYIGNVIALGQANIRKNTYKVEQKDYDKALNSEMCIIVELEEQLPIIDGTLLLV